MPTPPVNLGYGDVSDSQMDAVNQWMRSQPWYQQLLQSWGQDPNNVHLSDSQKQQLLKAAQANGVVVNEGHGGEEIDNSGNFTNKSNIAKDILEGAAIGGLALTGIGAAGLGPLAGLFGGGGAMAGVGPSTLANIAATSAAAAPPASLAATAGVPIAGAAGTLSKLSDVFRGVGQAVGGATNAAANNRSQQIDTALEANAQNISGQQAFVNELLGLSSAEDKQRATALSDVARESKITNPRVSPFDPVGAPTYSQQFKDTVAALANQGQTMLSNPATYQVSTLPKPTAYSPIDPTKLPGYNPSTLETVGNWMAPIATGVGAFSKLFG